ncbi:MAG TPA: DUF4395 domain-containing protein [Solirubrobacteraceae bacterium]|nr:DUF4395 domain-containing protein [Solirubrobacteraceae bacterium]
MLVQADRSASRGPRHRRSSSWFSFPDPVNEVSARLVAGGVVVLGVLAIALNEPWLIAVIAYGFVVRTLAGPKLSPLAQLVTRVITPRLGLAPRPVPGPPKRFAQAIGATFSVLAALLALVLGLDTAAYVLLGLLIVAATLESVFGYCLGCKAFAGLMRLGVIPPQICERCRDVAAGLPGAT